MNEATQFFKTQTSSDCMLMENDSGNTVISMVALQEHLFATGHCNGEVKIWDETQQQCLHTMSGSSEYVNAMALLPNGNLATGGTSKHINLWNINDRKCLQVLNGHTETVNALAVVKGRLVSAGEDIKMWDVDENKCIETFDNDVQSLAVLKEASCDKLLSGRADGTIAVWDLEKESHTVFSEQHNGKVLALVVLSNNRLVSAGSDRAIKIWDIQSKKCIETIWIDKSDWHVPRWFNITRISDELFAFGGSSKTSAIAIYDIQKKGFIHKLYRQFPPSSLLQLPSGSIVSGYQGGSLAVWPQFQLPHYYHSKNFHHEPVQMILSMAELPNNKFATGDHVGIIKLWNRDIKECIHAFTGHIGNIYALLALPNGNLVSGGQDGTIRVWDIQKKQCIHVFNASTEEIRALALFNDKVVSVGKEIKVWNIESGEFLEELDKQEDEVQVVTVLSDGMNARLVTGNSNGNIMIWDAERKRYHYLGRHDGVVCALEILSKDRLVSCGQDNTIKLWNPQTNQCLGTWQVDHSSNNSLVLTKLSQHLIAIGSQNNPGIYIFDTQLGKFVFTITNKSASTSLIALTDGALVSGNRDGTLTSYCANENLGKVHQSEHGEYVTFSKPAISSRMDTTKSINQSQVAITLFRKKFHAEILVEFVNSEGNYECKIWHVCGAGSSAKASSGSGSPSDFISGFIAKATVECIEDIQFEKIKWHAKSPTWIVSQDKLIEMERKIFEDQQNENLGFSLLGHRSWIHSIGMIFGAQKKYNCCSWALDKLMSAGICLGSDAINLVTNILEYTQKDVHIKEPDTTVLCEFAKQGRYLGIQKNFSQAFDVDQKTSGGWGSVEIFLGTYTPLTLAIAYGHLKTVKLLVEQYGANPHTKVGRLKDHDALDCAKRNFWFVNNPNKAEILEYIQRKWDETAAHNASISEVSMVASAAAAASGPH